MKLRFKCGHLGTWKDGDAAPICGCGERRIIRAYPRELRIAGTASGPLVQTQALDPATVQIGESRLSLKVSSDE